MPTTVVATGLVARSEADTDATSFQAKNGFAAANLATGNVFLGITSAAWFKFTGHGIPKNADILAADLDLVASIARGGVSTLQVEALDQTSRDWIPDSTTKWNRPLWGTFKANIRDTGGGTIVNTVPTAVTAFWGMKADILGRRSRLAVVFTPTANATLGDVLMHVRRSGTGSPSGTGSVFVEIMGVDANGDPDEGVLATSDSQTAASQPFPAADRSFVFSGAQQIPLVAGTTYAVVFNATDVADPADNVQWLTRQQFFSVAGSRHYGFGRDFDNQHYPDQGSVVVGAPSLGTTPVPWTVPATSVGTTYTSPDLRSLIQAIVLEAGYTQGGPIGLRVAPLTGGGAPPRRDWAAFDHPTLASAVLNVTYRLPDADVLARGADLSAVNAKGADTSIVLARGASTDTVSAAGADLSVVRTRGADLSPVKAVGEE